MNHLVVLVEGMSDIPTVAEILRRRFGLEERVHFDIRPHQGKGELPDDPRKAPDPERRGLLDLLPATLRAFGRWMTDDYAVVVLVDADKEDCRDLKRRLVELYDGLESKPPRILFRIAVEEIESWLIADPAAVRFGYPGSRLDKLRKIKPDAVVGAAERLAEAIGHKGLATGADKKVWAQRIVPHLNLDGPRSPSLTAFIEGVERLIPAS